MPGHVFIEIERKFVSASNKQDAGKQINGRSRKTITITTATKTKTLQVTNNNRTVLLYLYPTTNKRKAR